MICAKWQELIVFAGIAYAGAWTMDKFVDRLVLQWGTPTLYSVELILPEKMVESGNLAIPAKKTSMTPKAIIHQRFGDKACYKVDEVQVSDENECPGLAIPQKRSCLYRCTLQLPETVIVSDTFRKKKDAEQSAAEKAIEKVYMLLPCSLSKMNWLCAVTFVWRIQ